MSVAATPSLDATSVPTRVAGAEGGRFGADFVVLDASGKKLRGLNAVGVRVWELMDGGRTVENIARQLSEEYRQPVELVRSDVLQFIQCMVEKQLVTLRAASTPE